MPTIPTGSSIDKSVTDNPKLLKMFQTPADTSDPKKRLDRVLVIHSDTVRHHACNEHRGCSILVNYLSHA